MLHILIKLIKSILADQYGFAYNRYFWVFREHYRKFWDLKLSIHHYHTWLIVVAKQLNVENASWVKKMYINVYRALELFFCCQYWLFITKYQIRGLYHGAFWEFSFAEYNFVITVNFCKRKALTVSFFSCLRFYELFNITRLHV